MCHRQIPQQQKEQIEFTGSEKLPVYSTLMREVVCTTWKTLFTSHILDWKRKKKLSEECIMFSGDPFLDTLNLKNYQMKPGEGNEHTGYCWYLERPKFLNAMVFSFFFNQAANIYLPHHWLWRSCVSEVKYHHIAHDKSKGLSKPKKKVSTSILLK